MPPKRKSPRPPYPYTIPPFSGDPSRIRKTLPEWVNEYFLIEALLRSKPVMKAYRSDDPSTLITKLDVYGIKDQDPLKGTHHKLLLLEPREDDKWMREMAKIGWVDKNLAILDLGVLAKRPPKEGLSDGESTCLAHLRDTQPRYVCLRIDAAKPTETILQRLRVFLKDRHQQAVKRAFPHHPDGGWREFYRRFEQNVFRKPLAWLTYFRCYDLYQSGLTIEAAGRQVYPDNLSATEKANTAIDRVKRVIRYAECFAAEHDRAEKRRQSGKGRIIRPIMNRTFWPPQDIL